jgi:RNA polymerase sigma factor (sigma-70 family)
MVVRERKPTEPMTDDVELNAGPRPEGVFNTTHWSVVLNAGDVASPGADQAMARLCQTYWYPLYCYVRRRGRQPAEAQDLTQEFFARLLARNYLRSLDRQKGKFRWFLLAAVEHFLANEWHKDHCLKRGGGQRLISLDEQQAEQRYQFEPVDTLTPERIYERRWAAALLDHVMERLRQECAGSGKGAWFEALQVFLSGGRAEISQAQAGAKLGMSEGSVNVAVHRLRKRYGELLREEVAHTVSSREGIDEELRYLLAVVSA